MLLFYPLSIAIGTSVSAVVKKIHSSACIYECFRSSENCNVFSM